MLKQTQTNNTTQRFIKARTSSLVALIGATFAIGSMPFVFHISGVEEALSRNLFLPFLVTALAWITIIFAIFATRGSDSRAKSFILKLAQTTTVITSSLGVLLAIATGIVPALYPGPTSDKYMISLLFVYGVLITTHLAVLCSVIAFFFTQFRYLVFVGIIMGLPILTAFFTLFYALVYILVHPTK
jgi:hypothetical protein